MKLFWYRSLTNEGASVTGSGEFADLGELVQTLTQQGQQPYRVWSLPSAVTALFFRPLAPHAVAEFCHMISYQVRAGADLRMALEEASRSASTTRLRMLCARLRRQVERGESLSRAMETTRAFPALVLNLVVVGQETGRLGDILATAATQFEQMRQLRQALHRAMIYPAIVLAVLLASCVFWMVVVIPKMAILFDSMRIQVPPATRFILESTTWLKANGWWLPAALAAFVMLIVAALRLPALKPVLHAMAWWMPVLRRLERARAYHGFFSHLGAMHAAGLTLNRTLTVLVANPVNQYFGGRISRIGLLAGRGQSLAEGLAASGAFERPAIGLVRLGEASGSLDEQSLRLGEHYALRMKQQIETGSRLFEPLLLLVLAGLLLLVGSTVLGPVYEFAARASAGITR